jgi:hypothetical protein
MRTVVTVLVAGASVALAGLGVPGPAAEITFKKVVIDPVFRSEGVAVADFNGDGKKDIAAGSVYYAAPDWQAVPIRQEARAFSIETYSDAFCCFADDVNGDGRPDLVVVDTPGKPTCWFENPGKPKTAWQRHVAIEVTNNESPIWADVDGDGRPELICGWSPDPKQPNSPKRRMICAKPGKDPAAPWVMRAFSAENTPGSQMYSHGLGAGDVNGDGRSDVVIKEGWWENPKDKDQAEWVFHKAGLGQDCAHMIVCDFDGDGLFDVLSSSAHRYGIWWHRQTRQGWKTEEIDKSYSQTHAVCLADVNGDGLPDFVTGKRFWAHMGRDPGAREPALLVWYELRREGGTAKWTRHVIDENSGVGTQFEVADVNGDGLLDVAVSNKKGVHYFQHVRK